MKKLTCILTFLIISASYLVNASTTQYQNVTIASLIHGNKVTATGSMLLKGDIWVIRVQDEDGIIDYVPQNLAKEFQIAGLQVKFTGTAKNVSDTEKLAGIPLVLQRIRVIQ